MNAAQYAWYYAQMENDTEEKYNMFRDLAEYNAAFWNPDGVKQVQEARKNNYETSPEDFESFLEQEFGRKIPEKLEAEDPRKVLEDPYMAMDLDDITFTPYVGD